MVLSEVRKAPLRGVFLVLMLLTFGLPYASIETVSQAHKGAEKKH